MTELPVVIPEGFTTTITVGTAVNIGDTLAKCEGISEEAINLAEKLEVQPVKVPKFLKKDPGESVEVGEVLAAKSGFFSSIQIQSKVAGTVIRYERDSGRLIIQPKSASEQIKAGDTITAPVEGTVIDAQPTLVRIKTEKNVLAAVRGSGKSATADTYVVEGKKDEDLLYRLDAEAIGKIVLSEKVTREFLMKALGIGVAGVIVEDISEADLTYFREKEKIVPLIMIEKEAFEKIKKQKEKKVFVNGSEKVVVLLR